MTTLKTPREIVNNSWLKDRDEKDGFERVIKYDRQATADVLCALLDKAKEEADKFVPFQAIHHKEGLTLAQDIIRASLSNKDV